MRVVFAMMQATSLGGIGMHATSDGEGDGDDVCRVSYSAFSRILILYA